MPAALAACHEQDARCDRSRRKEECSITDWHTRRLTSIGQKPLRAARRKLRQRLPHLRRISQGGRNPAGGQYATRPDKVGASALSGGWLQPTEKNAGSDSGFVAQALLPVRFFTIVAESTANVRPTKPHRQECLCYSKRSQRTFSACLAFCSGARIQTRQSEACPTVRKTSVVGDMYWFGTNCAMPVWPSREWSARYAMIFSSASLRPNSRFVGCEDRCSTPIMGADRLSFSRRAMLFLLVVIGAPSAVWSASLEESAKEFARKIVAALPGRENVSCEIRNNSSLRPDEFARVEQAIRVELQDQGVRTAASGDTMISVAVTLSENWKGFVWTAEIRQGAVSHVVLLGVSRSGETRAATNAMHVTVRSEKFWEGPERILDAAAVSNGSGKSWLVLLQPSTLTIEDLQTGSSSNVDLSSVQPLSRDSSGQLGGEQSGNAIWFSTSLQVCNVNLETRSLGECLPKDAPGGPTPSRYPMLVDLTPAGSPAPGKGIGLVISPVCGGTNQFLATSARDYTQTDSLQVFQTEPNGPVAMSAELDSPGPIVALHTAPDAPRAIVRNLTTGNYEAYRLAISCGE